MTDLASLPAHPADDLRVRMNEREKKARDHDFDRGADPRALNELYRLPVELRERRERAGPGPLVRLRLDIRAAGAALLLAVALSAQIASEEDVLDRGGVPRLPAAFSPWAEVVS